MKNENEIDIPWVEKYRPQTLKEMSGFQEEIKILTTFVENFFDYQKQIRTLKKELKTITDKVAQKKAQLKLKSYETKFLKNKSRLLIGPPGVGKTTIAYALAKQYGLSVIELNASDARTEDALNQKLQETVKSTNLLSFTHENVKGKLILVDEVDGIHGQSDRGGVQALEHIIKVSRYPIVLCCNFNDSKLSSIFELSKPIIEVPVAKTADIVYILQRIVKNEKIKVHDQQLKEIAEQSNGDYRSAINDLQGLAQGENEITEEMLQSINSQRDTEENIQEFLNKLFESSSIRDAKHAIDDISSRDADFRTIHKWINENLLSFITKNTDLYFAFQYLAKADRILGYIGRTQDYGHLSYFYDILAGGIRFAKSDQKMVSKSLRPPRWFRYRAASDDDFAIAIQELYRVSLNIVMRELKPSIVLFLKYQPNFAPYVAKTLNLDLKTLKANLK